MSSQRSRRGGSLPPQDGCGDVQRAHLPFPPNLPGKPPAGPLPFRSCDKIIGGFPVAPLKSRAPAGHGMDKIIGRITPAMAAGREAGFSRSPATTSLPPVTGRSRDLSPCSETATPSARRARVSLLPMNPLAPVTSIMQSILYYRHISGLLQNPPEENKRLCHQIPFYRIGPISLTTEKNLF